MFPIIRSLPPLAKKYVLQMLYIIEPIVTTSMEAWVAAEGMSKHRVAIDKLVQLRLFTETVDRYVSHFTMLVIIMVLFIEHLLK